MQGASSWGVGWGVGGSRLLFTQMQTCNWMRDWLVNDARQRKSHETQRADRNYDAHGLCSSLRVFHRRVNVPTAKGWAGSCMHGSTRRTWSAGHTLIQLELWEI